MADVLIPYYLTRHLCMLEEGGRLLGNPLIGVYLVLDPLPFLQTVCMYGRQLLSQLLELVFHLFLQGIKIPCLYLFGAKEFHGHVQKFRLIGKDMGIDPVEMRRLRINNKGTAIYSVIPVNEAASYQ